MNEGTMDAVADVATDVINGTSVTTPIPGINIHMDGEKEQLRKENADLRERLKHAVMFDNELEFQPYIEGPPVQNTNMLYQRACSGDNVTIDSWLETWLKQMRECCETYDIVGRSAFKEYGKAAYQPVIIAGSGPSLKRNAHLLKERGNIKLVSCLHNFAYFEDIGVKPDYYVNLDSGPITIDEVSQGGKESPEHYWERTKEHVLLSALTGHPDMHKRWKGELLFYSVIASNPQFISLYRELVEAKKHRMIFSVGGNALGACLYMAKGVLGGNPIVYVGADFAFDYTKKFHSWDSPYDVNVGGTTLACNVYGHKVHTWQSYFNFKCWFDYIACGGQGKQPGQYINCTEGGILGAYAEGNIRQIQQMTLSSFLWPYNLHKKLPDIVSYKTPDVGYLY